MIIKLLLTLILLQSMPLHAKEGHETGNGGDTHLGRYLLAQHIAEVTMKRVSPSKLDEIFTDVNLHKTVTENLKTWPSAIAQMKFVISDKMLFESGKEKAALSTENSDAVVISQAYFEKYQPSLDEVLINVMHEAGHKLGIRNHQWLDQIGSTFVTRVYKYSDIHNEWLQYLNLDKSVKSSLDSRLRLAASEYLQRGEGIELAYVLYTFTRFHLMNSNLSQAFRYMAQAFFNVNIKKYNPQEANAYWKFKLDVQKRFLKEVVLHVRSMPEDKGLRLVKYGIAKLKVQGLVYTEGPDDFDAMANQLVQIMKDKKVDMETTVVNVMKFVRAKFYLFL